MDIPKTWRMVPLGELGKWGSGGTPPRSRSELYGGNIPWLKIGDLTDGPIWEAEEAITEAGLENSSAKLLAPGTILLAMYGSIGKIGITKISCATNQAIAFCICDDELIDQRYLFWGLRHLRPALIALGQGGTQQNISQTLIKQVPLPVAPRCEQRKIVEKIETLFAELDKGEEPLRQVQTLLARYRQSVLKAAVTGELTADWRAERAGKLEHGRDLLERILQTRRETWEGRGKYQEPDDPNTSALPELPEGWVWASFDQLFDVFGGATPSRREPKNWNGEIPWVSSGEVAFCRISDTKEKITQQGYESCSTKLHPAGTILLAMIGEGRTRGQAAILDVPACNNQNAAAIRVSETDIPPEYVYYYLKGRYEQSRNEGQGGNQPALNGRKVKAFVMPLPSLEEMREIVDRVSVALELSRSVEVICGTELSRSAAFRQSILKDAFSGRLVPQDPNDEPASELLARIRQSRDLGQGGSRRKKSAARA